MTLDQYLTDKNETAEAFANRIARSPSTITRLRKGETRPDWDTMDLIMKATNQSVKPNDFIKKRHK